MISDLPTVTTSFATGAVGPQRRLRLRRSAGGCLCLRLRCPAGLPRNDRLRAVHRLVAQ